MSSPGPSPGPREATSRRRDLQCVPWWPGFIGKWSEAEAVPGVLQDPSDTTTGSPRRALACGIERFATLDTTHWLELELRE